MSYKGMGTTATDIAAITTAASTAAAQLIAAATGGGATTPYGASAAIDPATGMPYATTINPATGMPYGAIDPMTGRPYGEVASDYTIPLVIGGLLVVGVGGYFLMKRGVRANRRRRSSRRVSKRDRDALARALGGVRGPGDGPRAYEDIKHVLREKHGERAFVRLRNEALAKRRRVRRNSKHKIRRSSVPWNYPCPGCGATELGKFGHGAGCKLAHHRLAGTFSVPKRKKSVRRNSGSWIVAIGNRGEYLAFYDYSAISGGGNYGVTKSQRDALHFRKYDHAASAANDISSGGGPSTRVVQPGEGVRRNSRRRSSRGMRRNSSGGSRPLREIAAEIRHDWKNPYFGAVPYLQAMGTLGSVNDSYGYDEGRSIVNYFLSNASGWRGPTAKRIKAELNAALRGR